MIAARSSKCRPDAGDATARWATNFSAFRRLQTGLLALTAENWWRIFAAAFFLSPWQSSRSHGAQRVAHRLSNSPSPILYEWSESALRHELSPACFRRRQPPPRRCPVHRLGWGHVVEEQTTSRPRQRCHARPLHPRRRDFRRQCSRGHTLTPDLQANVVNET